MFLRWKRSVGLKLYPEAQSLLLPGQESVVQVVTLLVEAEGERDAGRLELLDDRGGEEGGDVPLQRSVVDDEVEVAVEG